MHIPHLITLVTGVSLLTTVAASTQDPVPDTRPSSSIIWYELHSSDPDLGLAELDLLAEAYAARLARDVERVVGARGSVKHSGLRDVGVVLEGCTAEEIVRVARGPEPGLSGLCFVADEVVDMEPARAGLAALLAEQVGRPPSEVDVDTLSWVADDARYRWVAYGDTVLAERRDGSLDFVAKPLEVDDYELLTFDAEGAPLFTAHDFQRVALAQDSTGKRAIGVTVEDARVEEFGRFTGAGIGRPLAMVVDGRLVSQPPRVMDRLSDYFIISSGTLSGFSREEVMHTIVSLQQAGGLLAADIVVEDEAAALRLRAMQGESADDG